MKRRNRIAGLVLAFVVPFMLCATVSARPRDSVRLCGDAYYYCGVAFGHGHWICSSVC